MQSTINRTITALDRTMMHHTVRTWVYGEVDGSAYAAVLNAMAKSGKISAPMLRAAN